MQFRDALRQARVKSGLSQAKLGEAAAFDDSYVSSLESGKRKPSRKAVVQICDALRLDPLDRSVLFVAAGFSDPDGPDAATMQQAADKVHAGWRMIQEGMSLVTQG